MYDNSDLIASPEGDGADLTDEETAAPERLLSDAIDRDRYPLSRRIKMLRGILAKIRPEPPKASLAPKGWEPKPEPLPPQKPYEQGDGGGQLSCPPMMLGVVF